MTLSVTPSGNRQSWDARVRVTGGHPDLLWGIGEAEALTHEDVRVERVVVDRGDQTVGYGQLLVFPEDLHTVVDAKSLHVKNPRDLLAVLAALQDHARTAHGAAVLRVSPDTHATTELAEQLTEAGYRRRDRIRRGEAGPRHLVVRLGETEGELSKRLSSETLQRCRAGLRDSSVRVRRVNASDRDLSHVGLRTQHIRELLRAVGENSVFLVATERPDDAPETALGYLWFVHTGESAMVYRLGFTDRARELGVDDALLLTGLVQLQQRRVHKVLAGDPDQPGQPMVLRELATEDHEVLGTWEFPLVGEFQIAGRAEKTRRRFLPRRSRRARGEEILPEPTTAPDDHATAADGSAAPHGAASGRTAPSQEPYGPDLVAPGETVSDQAAPEGASSQSATPEGAEPRSIPAPSEAVATTTLAAVGAPGPDEAPAGSPSAAVVDADPDLARTGDLAPSAENAGTDEQRHGASPDGTAGRRRRAKDPGRGRRRKGSRDSGRGVVTTTTTETETTHEAETTAAAGAVREAAAEHAPADGLLRRALAEGRAAVRDAARW